jgi:hypothetical protein
MKEYVVEVEDVEMPAPRFSCLVGYQCLDVQLSLSLFLPFVFKTSR